MPFLPRAAEEEEEEWGAAVLGREGVARWGCCLGAEVELERGPPEAVLGLLLEEEDARGARVPCLAVTGPCLGRWGWGGGEREDTRSAMSLRASCATTDVRMGMDRERDISSREGVFAPQALPSGEEEGVRSVAYCGGRKVCVWGGRCGVERGYMGSGALHQHAIGWKGPRGEKMATPLKAPISPASFGPPPSVDSRNWRTSGG